jgi:hypothetical protein
VTREVTDIDQFGTSGDNYRRSLTKRIWFPPNSIRSYPEIDCTVIETLFTTQGVNVEISSIMIQSTARICRATGVPRLIQGVPLGSEHLAIV